MKKGTILFTLALLLALPAWSQNIVRGTITDAANGDALIGASVIISGTTEGTVTDWDGSFEFKTDTPYPFTIEASYVGFSTRTLEVTDNSKMRITLEEDAVLLEGVEVTDTRISDKQKESPLTIEAMDLISIKETPAADFYDGLGSLKGVDLTAASLGFKVVNTRGFNSTSPVRSLQTIDGVDNQAPGLNFSLGNFLGTSELDVVKVELIVGASSAFYGPNAFNGVIAMETKDPFFHQGLSAMVKGGERNMFKTAIRYADAIANKDGNDWFAYKANFEYLRADDWVADNYDPVDESRVPANNPGGFDAVNIYGDEYQSGNDFSDFGLVTNPGLQTWYRTGYREEDLVDYDTRNYKANVAFHFRTKPELQDQSPEILAVTNFGAGTTVYQGDNRFSLRNITFLQNKLEFRKKGEYFIRAYTTRTGAGDSYDPFFTALKMQELAKENVEWSIDYQDYWLRNIEDRVYEAGYPELQVEFDPETNMVVTSFDTPAAEQFLIDFNDSLTVWHAEAAAAADGPGRGSSQSVAYFAPGTERFDSLFNDITGKLRSEGGTRFFDNSALYHVHGEYKFTPTWIDYITVGANSRLYTPISRGTVFSDTTDQAITNLEFGFYGGAEKSLFDKKVKIQFAARADKNQNFDWLFSPAGSVVYTPGKNNFLRVSFSSAIRNPTLSDQYLFLDVGPAILSGNLNGANDLVTVESLDDFFANNQQVSFLDSFNIAPIRPERVRTIEAGYRTTLFDKVYLDLGYYYSIYRDFIGFQVGVDLDYVITDGLLTIQEIQPYRYAANSDNRVTTQGLAVGINYYFAKKLSFQGNYSWNVLLEADPNDPIIPAFNTPEHKFNVGISGRDLNIDFMKLKNFGFNINYKWIEGFLFEGSPQFTGFIPSYDMVDAQVNYTFKKIDTTLKVGASNLLNNLAFQTYGGPRIGRLAYITLTYEPKN